MKRSVYTGTYWPSWFSTIVGNWWYICPHSIVTVLIIPLQWRHNEHHGTSNHQSHDCLLNRIFGHISKKTSKLRATDLCAGYSPVAGEFPAQRVSNSENVSIRWRHHAMVRFQRRVWQHIQMSKSLSGIFPINGPDTMAANALCFCIAWSLEAILTKRMPIFLKRGFQLPAPSLYGEMMANACIFIHFCVSSNKFSIYIYIITYHPLATGTSLGSGLKISKFV